MGVSENDIKLIQSSSHKGCLIVGDIILDKYIKGDVSRISPEAPIPVLAAKSNRQVLGGAANVAGNVKGFKVPTYLVGVLGKDDNGFAIDKLLSDKQIEYIGLMSDSRRTTAKTRVIAMNQQLVRIDEEDVHGITEHEADAIMDNVSSVLGNISVVVLSDYNKGVCTDYLCNKLINLCKQNGVAVIVDPKSSDWTKYNGASLITPNFKEFNEVIGFNIDNDEAVIGQHAEDIISRYNLDKLLITRSQYGMTLVDNTKALSTFKAIQQEVYDVSGAGDTVIGTIAALLTKGMAYNSAVEIANYAAGLAVSKSGTYMVSSEEVIEYINKNISGLQSKIIPDGDIDSVVANWKNKGETIVFTNGCFDILHLGHIEYLNEARRLGTKLIVGLNSDASVKRLKGEERPINNERARAKMLAALQCVDAVVLFTEDTPENLICKVMPDVLVKGGDYKIEDIVGRQYAKKVTTIPITEGFSTTGIIEKLRK